MADDINISDDMKSILNKFNGRTLSNDTTHEIIENIRQLLNFKVNDITKNDGIDFEIKITSSKSYINPRNFFTALLMVGIYSPLTHPSIGDIYEHHTEFGKYYWMNGELKYKEKSKKNIRKERIEKVLKDRNNQYIYRK